MVTALPPATVAGSEMRFFHTCAFFHDRAEEARIISPFVAEGIRGGEKAVYIVDPDSRAGHADVLRGAGVPAEPARALDILDWNDTYLLGGRFDKQRMLEAVEATITAGLEEGFPRSRIVGQMAWALRGAPGSEQLLEYEVEVNDVLARRKHPAICVYYLDELSAEQMVDLLRVHPGCIVGGVLYENPFYVPAEQMLEELRARS